MKGHWRDGRPIRLKLYCHHKTMAINLKGFHISTLFIIFKSLSVFGCQVILRFSSRTHAFSHLSASTWWTASCNCSWCMTLPVIKPLTGHPNLANRFYCPLISTKNEGECSVMRELSIQQNLKWISELPAQTLQLSVYPPYAQETTQKPLAWI